MTTRPPREVICGGLVGSPGYHPLQAVMRSSPSEAGSANVRPPSSLPSRIQSGKLKQRVSPIQTLTMFKFQPKLPVVRGNRKISKQMKNKPKGPHQDAGDVGVI